MPKELGNHFIICNWNKGGERVTKEILSPDGDPMAQIVVIAKQEIEASILNYYHDYQNVTFINSDPVLHSILETARVDRAKVLLSLRMKLLLMCN